MEHDIINRDTNSVSCAENWKVSQREIFDAINISKIIVFDIIRYVACYSVAKFTLPIEQPSNMVAKCDIRGSLKLKVKPNLSYCSNIAMIISYAPSFVSSR